MSPEAVISAVANDHQIDPRLVRAHLANVVSSPQFAGSPRLVSFLTFVVETALAGQGDQIKESLIAIEVYGRRPDYNPQIDSTVRVEASRLRARLREYYHQNGHREPVEIELPKGKYVPVFCEHHRPEPQSFETTPARSFRSKSAIAVLVAVAAAVGAILYRPSPKPNAPPSQRTDDTADPKTMALYLRAHELLRMPVHHYRGPLPVPETVVESVRLFEEVTRRSPSFARGWVGLAEALEWTYEIDKTRTPEQLESATAAVNRAIELDPRLPEAWTLLTSIRFFRHWDIPGAEAASRRAIELNPRDVAARQRYTDLLRIQGRTQEARDEVARATALQPAAPNLRIRKALILFENGELEAAESEAESALAVNPMKQKPAYEMALWLQGMCRQRDGRVQEAEEFFRRGLAQEPHDPWNEAALGHLFASTGRKEEALAVVREIERQLALGKPRHTAIAIIYAGMGEKTAALEWLERGYAARETGVLFANLDWRLESLRSEPRYQTLLSCVRLGAPSKSPPGAFKLLAGIPSRVR
jgi:tetratricopeptide (TPR) repeat protein